ncbi:MAG: bifunctional DNA-formamidopyrimidine glycosylase/DNA-(apurinic or apyrimidinic site) lyase [Chloroflexota bacterium]
MPELPEVETIRSDLSRSTLGRAFVGVSLNWPQMVLSPSPQAFIQGLVGREVKEVDRRGKYLIVRLDSGLSVILHFKMSGSLLFAREGETDPYCRALFDLDDGTRLCFRDPRKLGKMWLVDDERTVVGRLGPEPLAPHFTEEVLARCLQPHHAPVKALLCDQTVLAGVGNMYADEALFAAGIHPLTRGDALSGSEVSRLHGALRTVLGQAVKGHGASITDYWRPNGARGTAQFEFKVAHRGGQPCPVCGTPIERVAIRNRGSYFCPGCQRGLC